jgi:hypothetical protein
VRPAVGQQGGEAAVASGTEGAESTEAWWSRRRDRGGRGTKSAGGRSRPSWGTRKTIGDLINSVAYSIYYNDHNFRYFKLFIIFGYYSAS